MTVRTIKLTGGQTATGSGVGNTDTDVFLVSGTDNQIYDLLGANVQVVGDGSSAGVDTATRVNLKSASHTTIKISLHGGLNVITNNRPYGFGAVIPELIGSTVTVAVSGGNAIGGNEFQLSNVGGSNTISFDGISDYVDASARYVAGSRATNAITTGADSTIQVDAYANNTIDTTNSAVMGGSTIYAGQFQGPFDTLGVTSIKISGDNNLLLVGSQKTTVAGGHSNNQIELGDGNNTVALTGTNNSIKVEGGNNVITAGTGNDAVSITGIMGYGLLTAQELANDPSLAQIGVPTDTVVLSGSNNSVVSTTNTNGLVKNDLAAGYEKVVVNGVANTGNSTISLGNATNSVTLGGYSNTISLGDGINTVALAGDDNSLTVTDPTGLGIDTINLGGGNNDVVNLGAAGGKIRGTGTGITTIAQSQSTNDVDITLDNSVGPITVSDGNDVIIANGPGMAVYQKFPRITAGEGNDTIVAKGGSSRIRGFVAVANGNDTVTVGSFADVYTGTGTDRIVGASYVNVNTLDTGTKTVSLADHANVQFLDEGDAFGGGIATVTAGAYSLVRVGNGNNVVSVGSNSTVVVSNGTAFNPVTTFGRDAITAGDNAVVTAGNSTDNIKVGAGSKVTVGNGHDSIAGGANSTVTINGDAGSKDSITVGAVSTVSDSGGVAYINGDAGNNFYLNGLEAGSSVVLSSGVNAVFLGTNSSANIRLAPSQPGDSLFVQAFDASGSYSGRVTIANFGANDSLVLGGLSGGDGTALSSYGAVLANVKNTSAGDVLALKGGGSILFDAVHQLRSSEFFFSSNTGPVHA